MNGSYFARRAAMSLDLYLLPLRFWQRSRAAEKLLERLDTDGSTAQVARVDVRTAADVLRSMEPRYTPFDIDYGEIAKFEKITPEQAKTRYAYVELNGPEDVHPPLAQFVFYRNHVVAHWYDGTSEQDMFRYLAAIARHAGLSLFDPQDGKVYRLKGRGDFA
jgi:hypothetical protein